MLKKTPIRRETRGRALNGSEVVRWDRGDVTVRKYDRFQEARRDGSRWATAWQAATVAEGRGTMGDGVANGHGRTFSGLGAHPV